MDELWSFVGNKGNPRWLWHAIEHHTGRVLASVFGRRQDTVFLQLKALLAPFGITCYYTDSGDADTRHCDADAHEPGTRDPLRIARQHLTLRIRITRCMRQMICCAQALQRPDLGSGVCSNRDDCGLRVEMDNVPLCPTTRATPWIWYPPLGDIC